MKMFEIRSDRFCLQLAVIVFVSKAIRQWFKKGISPQCLELELDQNSLRVKYDYCCSRYRTLSYLETISARSWSSFTAASCSVSDAGERTEEGEREGEERRKDEWVSTSFNTDKLSEWTVIAAVCVCRNVFRSREELGVLERSSKNYFYIFWFILNFFFAPSFYNQ